MCGIVGYVGRDEALPIILEGLRRLEYRGYDSAGVAVVDDRLAVVKRAGKLDKLVRALEAGDQPTGTVGMGHTRWATHGQPTDANAHPHLDCGGRIAVIHNGIIENFADLRAGLEKRGHLLFSETDTECIAHLIEEHADGSDLADAVRATVKELEGAYAIVVLSLDDPARIVGAKVSSPLVVGLGDGETLLGSDIPAVLSRTTSVIPVEEGQVVEVRAEGVAFSDFEGTQLFPQPFEVEWDVAKAQKGGFDDFMLKEIHEQPSAVRDTLVGRVRSNGLLSLDELHIDADLFREVDKVFVVACGSAFHAGMVAKYAIEHWTRMPVEIEIASEFRYRDPVLGPDTLTIAVSQSGETIDTLEAARHAARQGSHVLAVTNTVGSSLAREAHGVLYTHAGPEIGVAATKTFATQMVALHLTALYLAQVRVAMYPEEIAEVVEHMQALPAQVEPGVPVVAIATECHVYPKMLSNIQEVRARGADVIAVATEGDEGIGEIAQHVVFVPRTPELLAPVVVAVPLQLFAYHIAKLRGCDVDQPRNLAKSVTVE